jgi:hypothetical protein
MDNKELWIFPVPSTCINTGVILKYEKGDAILSFDYFDEEKEDNVYHHSIIFETVVCHRHSSEKFTKSLRCSYDKLIEISNSEWVNELSAISPEWAEYWGIKHFSIYLDGYGLYEFVAKDFKITDAEEGILKEGI